MRVLYVTTLAMMLTISSYARAQETPGSGTGPAEYTPGECVKAANDWRARQWSATPAAGKNADKLESLSSGARNFAKSCASHFTVESTPPGHLTGLSELYQYIGDSANARAATDRALASPELSPRQRGAALTFAMNAQITAAAGRFGIIDGAEKYVAQIDALPDSLGDIKLAAHSAMLSRYEYLDVDPGLEHHAKAVIDIARRNGQPAMMISAYESLARSAADMLRPADALKILDDAERELGSTPQLVRTFKDFRSRYALIGTRAAAIKGDWWINGPESGASVQPGEGNVTVVEFTAHWCAPCRNSYPGMRSLADRFRGRAFNAVLATSTYGYVGEQRNLTPEQEVAADREFFTKDHALPYPIAINRTQPRPLPGTQTLDDVYRVGGIPQIMIVDKHGIIRQIVTGWDQGNTERFGAYIEQLLAER